MPRKQEMPLAVSFTYLFICLFWSEKERRGQSISNMRKQLYGNSRRLLAVNVAIRLHSAIRFHHAPPVGCEGEREHVRTSGQGSRLDVRPILEVTW